MRWNEPAVRAVLQCCPAVASLDLTTHLLDGPNLEVCRTACRGMRSLVLQECEITDDAALMRWLDG